MCPRSVHPSTESDGDFATDLSGCQVTPEEVQAAIDRLPPSCRDLLKLHLIDGLSVREIAHREGLRPIRALRTLTRSYGFIHHELTKHRQSASAPHGTVPKLIR
jgi:DNA-directed RNA polymerase specialized sigma24 family protein